MAAPGDDTLFHALLDSAGRLSFDPRSSTVYELGPEHDNLHGMTPEWSPLYGTTTWNTLSENERIQLTRREVGHFLGVGIWLEIGLQIALLRRNHTADPAQADIKFLLNECADENLHSLMFVNAIESIGSSFSPCTRTMAALGWAFRTFAWEEVAYGIILAGEEMFDVMQRDWMVSNSVAEPIRRTAYIHIVEESRHMAFARNKIRERLSRASHLRRFLSTFVIAFGTHIIAKSLVNRRIYEDLGLDWKLVKSEIDANEHHRLMFRRSTAAFIEFLNKSFLLNRSARWIYRKSNLL